MDYSSDDKRKTKKDLKRKRQYRVYKRGGQFRSQEVDDTKSSNTLSSKKNKKKQKKL